MYKSIDALTDNKIFVFSGQAANLHNECDRRVQSPPAESNQTQNRDPHQWQPFKNAAPVNDRHHKGVNGAPPELETDPFPDGDLFWGALIWQESVKDFFKELDWQG